MVSRPLRVLFDARMASWDGIGSYTVGALGALASVAPETGISITALRTTDCTDLDELQADASLRWLTIPGSVWDPRSAVAAGKAGSAHADVFHSPHVVLPRGFGGVVVATIHDIIPLRIAEIDQAWRSPDPHRAWAKKAMFRRFLHRALSRADLVLFDSRHVAEQVAQLGRLPRHSAIEHLAPHPRFRPRSETEIRAVASRYVGEDAAAGRYILWVGGFRPHKNLQTLVRAYSSLPPATRRNWKLLLVGSAHGAYAETIRGLIAELAMNDDIRLAGRVPMEDLPALYSGAAVFVFPSLAEGFGLPPLEAAACGAPVLCADRLPLTEILGDSALYFGPTDHASLARELLRVLEDSGLRADLGARAGRRGARYSWSRYARALVRLYRTAADVRAG